MTLLSLICFFPTYIWITFSLLHKKLKNLFVRILIGIALSLLGVISLLIIDVVGLSLNVTERHNGTQCMFEVYRTNVTISYPALNMHWSVLIPANLLLEISPLIVITTTFEFISAQSPQSMKGFLNNYWSLLCRQRFFSVSQFNHHSSLFPQASVGQWREPSRDQLWLCLP